jgi:hypothetical protein
MRTRSLYGSDSRFTVLGKLFVVSTQPIITILCSIIVLYQRTGLLPANCCNTSAIHYTRTASNGCTSKPSETRADEMMLVEGNNPGSRHHQITASLGRKKVITGHMLFAGKRQYGFDWFIIPTGIIVSRSSFLVEFLTKSQAKA